MSEEGISIWIAFIISCEDFYAVASNLFLSNVAYINSDKKDKVPIERVLFYSRVGKSGSQVRNKWYSFPT